MPKDALTPQASHHFTRFDQVDQLVSAREADAHLGFMARLLALCSLPRTNPGNRIRYVRHNGPYKLGMTAGIDNKLPYGNFPRLILAWVCTGSGADRIVGAIRSGVHRGDAAYAAMTCRQIRAGFDCHGIGIANWRL